MSNAYYTEFEPVKRKAILDELEGPEAEKLRTLFELRYVAPKKAGFFDKFFKTQQVELADHFLAAWIEIKVVFSSRMGVLTRSGDTKRLVTALHNLGLDREEEFGDLLYQELLHMVRLYCHACLSDKGYGSTAFGLGHMSDEKVAAKLEADLAGIKETLPSFFKDESQYKLLLNAIEEVLADMPKAPKAPI